MLYESSIQQSAGSISAQKVVEGPFPSTVAPVANSSSVVFHRCRLMGSKHAGAAEIETLRYSSVLAAFPETTVARFVPLASSASSDCSSSDDDGMAASVAGCSSPPPSPGQQQQQAHRSSSSSALSILGSAAWWAASLATEQALLDRERAGAGADRPEPAVHGGQRKGSGGALARSHSHASLGSTGGGGAAAPHDEESCVRGGRRRSSLAGQGSLEAHLLSRCSSTLSLQGALRTARSLPAVLGGSAAAGDAQQTLGGCGSPPTAPSSCRSRPSSLELVHSPDDGLLGGSIVRVRLGSSSGASSTPPPPPPPGSCKTSISGSCTWKPSAALAASASASATAAAAGVGRHQGIDELCKRRAALEAALATGWSTAEPVGLSLVAEEH